MASLRKDVNVILDALRNDHGCEVTMGRGGHWRVLKPGCPIVTIAHSPSDPRALQNIRSDCRRLLGVQV